jgi:hypothetical protein
MSFKAFARQNNSFQASETLARAWAVDPGVIGGTVGTVGTTGTVGLVTAIKALRSPPPKPTPPPAPSFGEKLQKTFEENPGKVIVGGVIAAGTAIVAAQMMKRNKNR